METDIVVRWVNIQLQKREKEKRTDTARIDILSMGNFTVKRVEKWGTSS